jgi:hypothetical protein
MQGAAAGQAGRQRQIPDGPLAPGPHSGAHRVGRS